MKVFALSAAILLAIGASAQTDILVEGFTNGIPSTWTVVDEDGNTPAAAVSEYDSAWISTIDPVYGDTVASSTSFYDPADTSMDYLITPKLTLGGGGNYLYWRMRSADATFSDNMVILVSTTDSLPTSFTDTLIGIGAPQYWTSDTIKFDTAYSNQDIYLAFVNNTFDGFKLYLDDVRVEINNSVGLPQLEVELKAYPNPTNGIIRISAQRALGQVKVRDMSGRTVLSRSVELNSTSLDLSEFDSGIYLVEVMDSAPIRIVRR